MKKGLLDSLPLTGKQVEKPPQMQFTFFMEKFGGQNQETRELSPEQV